MIKKANLRLVCCLLVAIPLSLTACGDDPVTTLSKANSEYSENDFVSARLYLLTYLKEKPNDRAALMKLARSALFLGNGLEAETTLDRAQKNGEPLDNLQDLYAEALLLQENIEKARGVIAKIPEERSARAALLKGRAFAMSGDAANALRSLADGTAKHPDDADIRAETARVHLAQNNLTAAEASAKAALQLDPKSHEALLVNGELLLAQGRPQLAFDRFDAALRIWPVSVRALIGRAAAEGDLGRLDAMGKTLDAVNAIDENQPIAGLLRGQWLAKRDDWKGALRIVEILTPKMPHQPALFRLEGEAAFANGEPERAAKVLARYLGEKPNDRAATLLLAQAQLAIGDAVSAQRTLAPYADSPTASPTELGEMAKIATAQKLPAAAVYERKTQAPLPAFLADRIGRGNAALKDSRWAEAIDIYAELDEATGGKDAIVNNNLGWALFKAGRIDAALKQLAKAAASAPSNAAIAHSYGTVLLASGQNRDKAIDMLGKAATLAPSNANYAADLTKAKAAR